MPLCSSRDSLATWPTPLQTQELSTHRAREARERREECSAQSPRPFVRRRCNRDTPKKATERLQVAFSAPDVLHSGLWSLLEEFFFLQVSRTDICKCCARDGDVKTAYPVARTFFSVLSVFTAQRTCVHSALAPVFCTGHAETSHPARIL